MKMSKLEGLQGKETSTSRNVDYLTFHLNRPPPPIADTYSMFGVTINNDDAIIQSLESQVTLKYCITLKHESISVVVPIMTFEQTIY